MEKRNHTINILIVDGLNILARYSFLSDIPLYYNSELINIYPTFKFLQVLYNISVVFDINQIYVVMEIGRDLKKQRIYNEYKRNRIHISKTTLNKSSENYTLISQNRKIIIDILEKSKVKLITSLLVEGDTVIYGIVKLLSEMNDTEMNEYLLKHKFFEKQKSTGFNIYVLSKDSDLFQIFNTDFITKQHINKIAQIYDFSVAKNEYNIIELNKNTKSYINVLDFVVYKLTKNSIIEKLKSKYSIDVDVFQKILPININALVSMFKILHGDKTDNIIPSVSGYGFKSFFKLILYILELYINNVFTTEKINVINDFVSVVDKITEIDFKSKLLTQNELNKVKLYSKEIVSIARKPFIGNVFYVNKKLVDLEDSFKNIDINSYTNIKKQIMNNKEINKNELLSLLNLYEIDSIFEWSGLFNKILLDGKISLSKNNNIDRLVKNIYRLL